MTEYRDPEWLQRKYWGEGLSYAQMADEADVAVSTIQKWMNRHDIDRRSRAEGVRQRTHPWVGISGDGYTEVQHVHKGETYTAKIHRLCAVAWFGIDYGDRNIHVHHKSGWKFDNREENLEPLTDGEHKERHWADRDRSKLKMGKLQPHEAIEIRDRAHAEPHADLATEYGVSKSTISAISTGRNWSHLGDGGDGDE